MRVIMYSHMMGCIYNFLAHYEKIVLEEPDNWQSRLYNNQGSWIF